ncbi:MAG: hypothetical protein JXJ04_22800 [Spirochaetales bacterium]|nr:hypothetical protein [Spirochaetales bacterium]
MKLRVIILIVTLVVVNSLFSQGTDLPDENNIDSLFEDNPDPEATPEPQDPEATMTPEPQDPGKDDSGDLLSDVLKKSDLTLGAEFKFYIGYSPGWDRLFWDVDGITELHYLDTTFMIMQSIYTLNFQISKEFRVLQKYTMNFPEFDTKVTEFFCDYIILDSLFLRIGRQKLTWGISRNFPFTNLMARIPDNINPDLTDPDSYSVKMNIPIGIGGLEALVFTREAFFPDADLPAMEDMGYGTNLNIATHLIDINLGTYYHEALHYRSYGSLSFTLFDKLEVYAEGLVAVDTGFDENAEADLSGNPVDGSFNLGFYLDFFSGNLEINGEYFFNGEESECEVKGAGYPLFYGHNIAANISLKVFHKKLRLFSQYKCNINEESHVLIPGMTIDILPHFSLLFTIPVILGSPDGGYYTENPDTEHRAISFVFALLLSGKK